MAEMQEDEARRLEEEESQEDHSLHQYEDEDWLVSGAEQKEEIETEQEIKVANNEIIQENREIKSPSSASKKSFKGTAKQ